MTTSKKQRLRERTYCSLSLLLLLPLLVLTDVPGASPSFLLSSIALRICSASSYAASRLFIVERRFPDKLSAFAREDLLDLGFVDRVSWGAGDGDDGNEANSCTGT